MMEPFGDYARTPPETPSDGGKGWGGCGNFSWPPLPSYLFPSYLLPLCNLPPAMLPHNYSAFYPFFLLLALFPPPSSLTPHFVISLRPPYNPPCPVVSLFPTPPSSFFVSFGFEMYGATYYDEFRGKAIGRK